MVDSNLYLMEKMFNTQSKEDYVKYEFRSMNATTDAESLFNKNHNEFFVKDVEMYDYTHKDHFEPEVAGEAGGEFEKNLEDFQANEANEKVLGKKDKFVLRCPIEECAKYYSTVKLKSLIIYF